MHCLGVHDSHLTDLPLIPDKEMDEWVKDIVENTHYKPIRLNDLRNEINAQLRAHQSGKRNRIC